MSFELLTCAWIISVWCLCAKLLHSCLTLCNPRDPSPLGSSVYGILQAIILEWVAMPSSGECSQSRVTTCICLLLWDVGSSPLVPPRKPVGACNYKIIEPLIYNISKVWGNLENLSIFFSHIKSYLSPIIFPIELSLLPWFLYYCSYLLVILEFFFCLFVSNNS